MLALVLSRPLTSALVALLVVVLAVAGVQTFRVSRLHEDLSDAKAGQLKAEMSAFFAGQMLTIEERRHKVETRIIEVANVEAAALRADVRGADPVDAGLLARWRSSVERVRAASGAATDDPGAGEPAGTVPASEP